MSESNQRLGALVADLCETNMALWKEEDKARGPDDADVVKAKRNIDKLNQKRNDLIERIDDFMIKATQGKAG